MSSLVTRQMGRNLTDKKMPKFDRQKNAEFFFLEDALEQA